MPTAAATSKPEGRNPTCAPENLTCYAVMMRRDDRQVLLCQDADFLSVPTIDIPRRQRVSPNLLSSIKNHFGLLASCRFSVDIQDIDSEGRCVVVDVLGDEPLRNCAVWIAARQIQWSCIRSDAARRVLRKAMEQARAYRMGRVPGEFVRPGWMNEVSTWVSNSLAHHHVGLRGTWLQYNMGPDFSLIRFNTDGRDIWFKAVGAPNLREFTLTRQLWDLRLPNLAPLLGVHDRWHGWLMYDCGARFADESADRSEWACVARGLAELQIASIPHSEPLIAAGCQDLRASVMRDAIEPFLSDMAILMQRQPACPPQKLGIAELRLIEERLYAACHQLEILAVPDALGHSDLNSGNILIDTDGPVFLDWMQGFIGSPFLAFEYLLALVRLTRSADAALPDILRDEYLRSWKKLCSSMQIDHTLEVIPLLAPFAFALTCWDPHTAADELRSGLAAFLRSLTRRMYAAASRTGASSRLAERQMNANCRRVTTASSTEVPSLLRDRAKRESPRKGGEIHEIQQT